jgi:CcmD family protein
MSGLEWVIGASAVIWLSIAAYVAFIAYRQKDIDRRLALLEEEHEQS